MSLKELLLSPSQGEEGEGGGGVGGWGSLFPIKIGLCSLVPEITFKLNLNLLIPKIVYVPLFPKLFSDCSHVPQFKLAIFSCSPKPLEGTYYCKFLYSKRPACIFGKQIVRWASIYSRNEIIFTPIFITELRSDQF